MTDQLSKKFIIHFSHSKKFEPYLSVTPSEKSFNSSNSIEQLFLRPGDDFNIKIGDIRRCIGHRSNLGEWSLCSSGLPLLEGEVQCYRCSRDEFYQCRALCQGDFCTPSSPKAKKLCTPPNTEVYLTIVAGQLKIGVSLNAFRRWLQQGSEIGVILAKGPGLEARRYEKAIGQLEEITMSVRTNRKIKHLKPTSSFSELKEQLIAGLELIQQVEAPKEVTKLEIIPDEIVNLAPYYGELEKLESTPLLLTKEDKLFGGIIVGQKGSFLVLQDDKTPLTINLNYLMGFDVEFLSEKPERSGQKSLMDFF
ncbi:MAG: DUF2797 domain-containing protein [Candidatus Kariarchaeaceae archaeon]